MTNLAPSFDQPSTWTEMMQAMRERYENNSDERLGQAAFNALYRAWPEVAEEVRSSTADPFYAEKSDDPRYVKFLEKVSEYFV